MSALRKTMIRWPRSAADVAPLALWTSAEIAAATGGTASAPFQVSGVEMDSRDVRCGDLFVALRGENSDGHLFLEKAFANGAVAAIVDRPIDQPHVLVSDTSSALELLAQAARNRASGMVIGVT
ncbi:MAG: UDP-N-acetylmuramoyl-tripeptide--D-alanyl-D-alanine ligase, partial [Pseudomonadota bacterium]